MACVNPANLSGGVGPLSPYFLRGGSIPWVTYPGLYDAVCDSSGGATWLQVNTLKSGSDSRPVVSDKLRPAWGYHGDDVDLALGNLVADVAAVESAYKH